MRIKNIVAPKNLPVMLKTKDTEKDLKIEDLIIIGEDKEEEITIEKIFNSI